ncbi:MAG: hypothetical protein LBE31_06435 [Deltaproteobacteria bacterium]|jgi:hypothetical protein|nr:hypothetical protein [Deltaproteobacteria bacterium]
MGILTAAIYNQCKEELREEFEAAKAAAIAQIEVAKAEAKAETKAELALKLRASGRKPDYISKFLEISQEELEEIYKNAPMPMTNKMRPKRRR